MSEATITTSSFPILLTFQNETNSYHCPFTIEFLFTFSQQSPVKDVTYPGSTWDKIVNPYQSDWDSLKLSTLRKYIIDSTHATGIVVVWRGKILLEYGDIEELSYLASARKSLLAMLYGPYVDNGTINLSTTLAQINFDDREGLLPIEKKAAIKDIITARSGIYHPASNSGDESAMAPQRGTKEPGSFYLYNNWDSMLPAPYLNSKPA